jgi:mRNA-degrading endonuclease RelE of RelBE toxin-antitoxin system
VINYERTAEKSNVSAGFSVKSTSGTRDEFVKKLLKSLNGYYIEVGDYRLILYYNGVEQAMPTTPYKHCKKIEERVSDHIRKLELLCQCIVTLLGNEALSTTDFETLESYLQAFSRIYNNITSDTTTQDYPQFGKEFPESNEYFVKFPEKCKPATPPVGSVVKAADLPEAEPDAAIDDAPPPPASQQLNVVGDTYNSDSDSDDE